MHTTRNWTYLTALVIVYGFLLGTAAGSFHHIVIVGDRLGLGWEAWTVPFLVDGIALMGKMGRGRRFAESTQRAGLRLMAFGGTLSLACNIYAGENLGQRCFGGLLVAGFLIVEWYAGKLSPAAPAKSIARSAAAVKAAATRAARKVEAAATQAAAAEQRAAAAERRRLARQVAELEQMAAGYVPADAPVSPAPGEAAAYL